MERYLKEGTKLQLNGIDGTFVIRGIIGRGSSCVVYKTDFINELGKKSEHILKEFNPKEFQLERDETGDLVLRNEAEREVYETYRDNFVQGYEKQELLRRESGLKNYTANVQNFYEDHETVYIDMSVTEGVSYNEVEEKSLYDLARRMKVLSQVVDLYHDNGYLHLDLKPSNIYVRPETETCEDVLLFDFDSMIRKEELLDHKPLSYTEDWAALELISSSRRKNVCEATDIFAIGEMFFTKLMGRHSEQWERRSFSEYEYDYESPIFENVNPSVSEYLDELFRGTLCNTASRRFQSVKELVEVLDKIINVVISDPAFLKNILIEASSKNICFDIDVIKQNIQGVKCSSLSEYEKEMNRKVFEEIIKSFDDNGKLISEFKEKYNDVFALIEKRMQVKLDGADISDRIIEIVNSTRNNFLISIQDLLDFKEAEMVVVNVQSEIPKETVMVDLTMPDTFWTKIFGKSITYYVLPLQCVLNITNQISYILRTNEDRIRREFNRIINVMFENITINLRREFVHRHEGALYDKAINMLCSGDMNCYEEGMRLLFLDYDERKAEETKEEINRQLPIFDGEIIDYINNTVFFVRKKTDFDWGGGLLFVCKGIDGIERIILALRTEAFSVSYISQKRFGKLIILLEDSHQLLLYQYIPDREEMELLEKNSIPPIYGELFLDYNEEGNIMYGKHSYIDSGDDKIFRVNL